MDQIIRDGDWTLLDHDIQTGRTVWYLTNDDGSITVRTDYPVEATIEENKAARLATEGQRFGDWNRAASVPLNVFHASGLHEAIRQDDNAFVKRFLNDSDNRAWRTSRGSV